MNAKVFKTLNELSHGMKKQLSTKRRGAVGGVLIDKELRDKRMWMEAEIRAVQRKYQEELYELEVEKKLYDSLSKYGWIYISTWSRDCDMCESTSVRKCQSLKAYYKYIDSIGEWAEGPVSVQIISKEDYDDFNKPRNRHLRRVRDRIMEAYENGNGSSILV